MRKIILTLSIIAAVILLLGADIRRNESSTTTLAAPKKKKCIGYTILEFGKGVDCNGDTVKLVKMNGIQVLASSIE
ncbi:MAG TPA: hypothetical protein VEB86_04320 [Chryseosolibacter sp.]|nr:hypothetical protein [Chryseosolibacter sp.]